MKTTLIQHTTLVLALLILTFLPSCLGDIEDPYEPIEGNLNVRLYEQLDSINRIFTLIVETEKEYECSNFVIDNEIEVVDSVIVIRLKQIYKDNICYSERGPARAVIQFFKSNWDLEHIRFEMENFSRQGIIYKDTTEYRLKLTSAAPLIVKKPVLKRVPKNTIWGMIEYNDTNSLAYIDTFFMYLDTLGAEHTLLDDGDYNFFEIKKGQIFNPGSVETNFSDVFLYSYKNSFTKVEALSDYVARKSKDLRIRVSSDGSDFHYSSYAPID